MKLPRIQVPLGTPAIVVDPLKDFLREDGEFVKWYGAEDCEPIFKVEAVLDEMTAEWQHKAWLILCRSLYETGKFPDAPKNLCTADNAYGRESVIDPRRFDYKMVKNDNSILRTADTHIPNLFEMVRHSIVTGITSTSCVPKSVDDVAQNYNLQLIVPRNAVAARVKQQQREKDLFEFWSQSRNREVAVVDDWRDIEFVPE